MKREERIQLENLSKLVYGSKNHYKKMIEKGEIADLSEKLEDGTERKYRGVSRYSLEEVKKIMQEIWAEELERQEKDKNEKENKKFHEEMQNEKTQEASQETTN